MDEKKIINKCKDGDKDAFHQLITRYEPYVYKFLISMTGDENISEDLMQETFIKLIRSIDKFDLNGKAKFSTYVLTLCRNCYIDYYRKNKKYINNVPIEESITIAIDNIEEKVFNNIYSEQVIEKLKEIPEEQSIAIKLKYIEGLTLKEIGEQLEVNPKTIKSRIHNGIVKLRKMLEGEGENGR